MNTRSLKTAVRICAVAALFALVGLSFRACHSLPLQMEHPLYSLIAQYPSTSPAMALAD